MHFFFTAMKRWKFWNHCNECDEFAMKKKDFFQVENWLKIEILKKITKKVFFFLKSRFFWTKNCEKIQKIAKTRLKLIMQWIFPLHCDEFSLQRFFSLRWIHCLLASVHTTYLLILLRISTPNFFKNEYLLPTYIYSYNSWLLSAFSMLFLPKALFV